jgi:hypothetical protein
VVGNGVEKKLALAGADGGELLCCRAKKPQVERTCSFLTFVAGSAAITFTGCVHMTSFSGGNVFTHNLFK